MSIELNSTSMKQVIAELRRLVDGETADAALLRAGRIVGIKAEELVGEYPPPFQTFAFRNRQYTWPNGTRSKFKSRKQQRKVFALIKEGKIPTRRTGELGRAIRSEAALEPGAVRVKVGTTSNVDHYASYVLGLPEEQALVHQNVWTPLETTLEENSEMLGQLFITEVQKAYG